MSKWTPSEIGLINPADGNFVICAIYKQTFKLKKPFGISYCET